MPRSAQTGKVLVVGGTGRVGGSTSLWLQRLAKDEGLKLEVSVGGRSRDRYNDFVDRWRRRGEAQDGAPPAFVELDHMQQSSVDAAISRGWDLVVHTAGPFQGLREPVLLQSAVRHGVPYVDVCDDTDLCKIAKDQDAAARSAKIPAVVSAGIWPGVSALMIAEAKARLGSLESVEMSFFTAGTGGAGPTIVSATFLLLAEPPLTFKGGREKRVEAWGDRRLVDFGPGVGERYVHLLDEPEVYTCHRALGIPNIRSSFGTWPDVWNLMFGAARALPASVLRNRGLMQGVANFSMPIIAAVDKLVGSTNAMRIDATGTDGRKVTLRITHADLEDCVGLATAAFGMELLQASLAPGVWFPVEMESNRQAIFQRVKRGTILWEL